MFEWTATSQLAPSSGRAASVQRHRAADPQDGPRAAESEAAADSTGTTTRRPLITTTAHGPVTRRLRPNQWSKLDTQNRTTSGNRVTAHNAHELFISLQAATFWTNFDWIVASTCGAPATHNHFLLLSKLLTERDFILPQFPYLLGLRPFYVHTILQ